MNKLTIRPFPYIDQLFDQLVNAKWFSKIDLRTGYWKIRLDPEDQEKTAFRARYGSGSFEFTVLPMGITNAVETFQTLMQHIFMKYLEKFVIVYLDDVVVYSVNLNEHMNHLRIVFQILREKKLYCKCEFFKTEIKFLGHVISKNKLMTDPSKIEAIMDIKVPTNVKQLQSFLEITNYYRKFIRSHSEIALPLTKLLKESETFIWTAAQQKSFELLKSELIKKPILVLPDMKFRFSLITDASKFAI